MNQTNLFIKNTAICILSVTLVFLTFVFITGGSLSNSKFIVDSDPIKSKEPEPIIYTATFNKNGVDSIISASLSCETDGVSCSVTAPGITREGYTILGWSANPNGKDIVKVGDPILLRKDVTYYAITEKKEVAESKPVSQQPAATTVSTPASKPVEKTFTATFNKNGATGIGTSSLSCKTTGNYCNITAPSITRSGYNIIGWSTSTAGNYPIMVGSQISLTGNVTYYAITTKVETVVQPIERTFTATFIANGATSIGSASLSCRTTGNSCSVTAPSITRSGYNIVGWSTSTAGTNPIRVGSQITLTGNTTYYAITAKAETVIQPTERTFTATFIANGATSIGSASLSCRTTGNSCSVTAPSITRSGYNIIGWSTSTAGTNSIRVGNQITLTGNTTYYAITEMPNYAYYIDGRPMLAWLNTERSKVGASSLTFSIELEAAAKIRAEEICRSYSHTRPDGSNWTTVSPLAKGENLATGNSEGYVTGTRAFEAWMESQGHKENMLRPQFRTVGIAGYYCPSGRYKYQWVQLFGY